MLPVVAMWGHLCGLDMTATTAIPDAVLTGFAFSLGSSCVRCSSGTAAIISTSLGARCTCGTMAAMTWLDRKLPLW